MLSELAPLLSHNFNLELGMASQPDPAIVKIKLQNLVKKLFDSPKVDSLANWIDNGSMSSGAEWAFSWFGRDD